MKKIFHLSTCDTCKRILKELDPPPGFSLQDIKTEPLDPQQLEELKALEGSYEALFNRRAKLYREKELHQRELEEKDYRDLLLEHYTFLKRPVILRDNKLFVGNSKKMVEAAKKAVHE